MTKNGQKAKVAAAKRYMRTSHEQDLLYTIVVIMGPAVFGSIFRSNSDTVWDRVEKPLFFRLDEIIAIAELLEIPISQFIEILVSQATYNKGSLANGLPIGRKKYQR